MPPDVIVSMVKCTKFDFDGGSAPSPAGAGDSVLTDRTHELDLRGLLLRERKVGME